MDTETTTTITKPAPKKKATRKKRRVVAARAEPVAPAAQLDELAGLSPVECPIDCVPTRCVITCANQCGHPNKGGLQSAFQNKPDAAERYRKARKILAHIAAEKKQ